MSFTPDIAVGDVVQALRNPGVIDWRGVPMVVTDVRAWGVIAEVRLPIGPHDVRSRASVIPVRLEFQDLRKIGRMEG